MWREAATPTKAAATDQAQKLAAMGLPFGEYMMKLLGMTPQEQDMLERDQAKGLRNSLMQSLQARQFGPSISGLSDVHTDPEE